MLKPHIDLSNDPNHSREQIGASYTTDQQWSDWFASYTNFIIHYAQLAQKNGVEQLCVGTELLTSQGRDADWRKVIASVRSAYSGPLVYAATYEHEDLTWWNAVDIMGVDAYYTLSTDAHPSVAALNSGWKAIATRLASLAAKNHKKIQFSEIGYRNLVATANNPWDDFRDGPADMQGQANAYEAAFETFYNQSWFSGFFWWSWGTDPLEGGLCNTNFTPHDKLAEDVLRKWFGATPRKAASRPAADEAHTLDIYTDGLASGWQDESWNDQGNLPTSIYWLSNTHVHSGSYAVDATLNQWWALSMGHDPIPTSSYYYLEFYIWDAAPNQQLDIFFHGADGQVLNKRPIADCRNTGNKPIEPGTWAKVQIPLADLSAANQPISRLSFQSTTGFSIEFWIDDIRLVAAK